MMVNSFRFSRNVHVRLHFFFQSFYDAVLLLFRKKDVFFFKRKLWAAYLSHKLLFHRLVKNDSVFLIVFLN